MMTIKIFLRNFCSTTIKSNVKALPFDKIPGPKGVFGIGNLYNYLKVFGEI